MQARILYFIIVTIVCFSACEKGSDISAASPNSSNGSLTRFITVNNFLYIIDNSNLKAYDITNGGSPVLKKTNNVGFAIQTIFPYQDKLFIGSSSQMYIYSIANPAAPTLISSVPYFVRGKDPVVAVDSVAYSTVRDFGSGVLNIFNIKNITQPIRLGSIGQENPYGLGLKDSALYVCNASAGLSVYNIKNKYNPVFVTKVTNGDSFYDVIINGNLLICYIAGGISIFDISNLYLPVRISRIVN